MVFHSLWGWEKRYFVLPGSFLNFPPRAPPGTAVPRTPAFQRNRAIEFSPRHARKEESGRGHPAPRKGAAAPLTPASGEHYIALHPRRDHLKVAARDFIERSGVLHCTCSSRNVRNKRDEARRSAWKRIFKSPCILACFLSFCSAAILLLLRERRWQDMQKSARLLHPLHQSEHSPDVLPVKDAPVDDRPAALVIGADDLVEIAMKIVPQPAQILRSQADVIPEIVRIALYMRDGIDACGGIGHDLHDPDTSVA